MDLSGKRILITGISGYVGHHLRNYLNNRLGCTEVYGICRDSSGSIPQTYAVNLENLHETSELIKQIRPDIVYHLASRTEQNSVDSSIMEYINSNIVATTNLVTAIHENNIKLDLFMYFGTCAEYGDSDFYCDETFRPSPLSFYAGTKSASMVLCKMFHNMFDFPVIMVRPSLIYGPGQSEKYLIPYLIERALGHQEINMTHGEQTRDFIYIDDFIHAIILLSKCTTYGETYNICCGESYAIKDIVEMIKGLIHSNPRVNFGSIPYRKKEIFNSKYANTKLMDQTGWSPTVSILEGLEKTIQSFTNNLIVRTGRPALKERGYD